MQMQSKAAAFLPRAEQKNGGQTYIIYIQT